MKRTAVDPGHGGSDPGAVGHIKESDLTYKWATAFMDYLLSFGFMPFQTHAKPPYNRRVKLRDRVATAHMLQADLYVSIHADAWKTPEPSGASVWIYSARSIAADIAEAVQPALAMGIGDRGIKLNPRLYVLRKTGMPALLLETGFVSNPDDAAWLEQNYAAQACRVARALQKYNDYVYSI
jgi:N-acetylmuramoyl-L-alanine amidase